MENEKILELMEKMYSEMQQGFKDISGRLVNLEKGQDTIKAEIKELKEGQSRIEKALEDLEPRNAARHTDISLTLNDLKKDVKYIKHKLHENEEEIFDIKDHLKIIK